MMVQNYNMLSEHICCGTTTITTTAAVAGDNDDDANHDALHVSMPRFLMMPFTYTCAASMS